MVAVTSRGMAEWLKAAVLKTVPKMEMLSDLKI